MNNELKHLARVMKAAFFWIAFAMFLLYWISEKPEKRYVNELEKVVARCLDGGAITVGGEVYLCNTYAINERI